MICKRCGAKFSDGIFCPECGSRIVPVSVCGGEEQTNIWENALQYSDEDGYNTKIYGPQGQLGKMSITETIKINTGGERIFENKKVILKDNIQVGDNAKLEFRNCEIITDKSIIIGANVNVIFEGCVIKTKESRVLRWEKAGSEVKFLNCAFVGGKYKYLGAIGSSESVNVYFDNCFFNGVNIAELHYGVSEFRNCVIINDENDNTAFITVGEYPTLIFENCFIKSNRKLIRGIKSSSSSLMLKMHRSYNVDLRIRNSYIDNYIHQGVSD